MKSTGKLLFRRIMRIFCLRKKKKTPTLTTTKKLTKIRISSLEHVS